MDTVKELLYNKVKYAQQLEFECEAYKREIAMLHNEIKKLNRKIAIKNKMIEQASIKLEDK